MRAVHAALFACLLTSCGGSDDPEGSAGSASEYPPVPRPAPGVPTTPAPAAADRAPTSPLEALQFGVVGRWHGTATSLTDAATQFPVWFDLRVDGSYSAGCMDSTCISAFGHSVCNDADYPTKRYAIYDLAEPTTGIGEIGILIGDNVTSMLQTRRGNLRNIILSSDKSSLRFDLSWSPMKFRYDLKRATR